MFFFFFLVWVCNRVVFFQRAARRQPAASSSLKSHSRLQRAGLSQEKSELQRRNSTCISSNSVESSKFCRTLLFHPCLGQSRVAFLTTLAGHLTFDPATSPTPALFSSY